MRLVFISDTHSLHYSMTNPLPKGDVLIHAGDCTNVARINEVKDFVEWFCDLKDYSKKIFIAGNHDIAFETKPSWLNVYLYEPLLTENNVVYLEDKEFLLESNEFSRPLKVYGSPWQPEFYNWAFNLPRNGWELEVKWQDIPNDTDVLITHGPPFGILDYVADSYGHRNVGCELLTHRLQTLHPLIHVFGHIHYSYGYRQSDNGTLFINGSICTEGYKPTNKPIVVDVTETNGVFKAEIVTE